MNRTFRETFARTFNPARAAAVAGGILLCLFMAPAAFAQPLPSWNPSPAKQAIIDFVTRVTSEGSSEFVPPAERIAVFDNDGTLWAEKPVPFQFLFALDEIRRMAPQHPEWNNEEPFKSVLNGDMTTLAGMGKKAMAQIMATTHAGMTTDAFAQSVSNWITSAEHPQRHVAYTKLVYQPQLELLDYLRAHGFKIFIVSGGGVEFMRVFAEEVYGIPPEQVIGSSGEVEFRYDSGGEPELIKQPQMEFVDDGPGKPVGINRFIGHRPLMAVGNSDGDLQMIEYTIAGEGPRLAVYIRHDDAEREYSYDRADRLAKLDKGLDEAQAKGWPVVSMKKDWTVIFPASQ
jgi:phosphoglycolate phosphatase-like HAD superfamily hydrolase